MSVFVDTSALYALVDEDDLHYEVAASTWGDLLDHELLVTHTYVVVETSALLQRRFGTTAAARLHQDLLPPVSLLAIDADTHARSVDRWLADSRRHVSLVDVTSFVVMEASGLTQAFAYDSDFVSAGFTLVGSPG